MVLINNFSIITERKVGTAKRQARQVGAKIAPFSFGLVQPIAQERLEKPCVSFTAGLITEPKPLPDVRPTHTRA